MPELKSQNLKNVFAEHLEIYNQEDQGHTTFKLGWTEIIKNLDKAVLWFKQKL